MHSRRLFRTFGRSVHCDLTMLIRSPRDPSLQILPTSGPEVCEYHPHWAMWTPIGSIIVVQFKSKLWQFLGPCSFCSPLDDLYDFARLEAAAYSLITASHTRNVPMEHPSRLRGLGLTWSLQRSSFSGLVRLCRLGFLLLGLPKRYYIGGSR